MRLQLIYGSDRPGPEAVEYGFDGPTLYRLVSVQSIYAIDMTIRFRDLRSLCDAERITGWKRYGDVGLFLVIENIGSFIRTREPSRDGVSAYYGQYVLVDEYSYSAEIKRDLADLRSGLERITANIR